MDWRNAFSLLDINVGGGRASETGGGGRRGRDTTSSGPGWSNKDTAGNSSIAQRNQDIRDQQVKDKTREAYEREQRKEWNDQNQKSGDTGKTPLTDAEKAQRESFVDGQLDKYDVDPNLQSEQFQKTRPDLSSNEKANLDRSRQAAGNDPKDNRSAETAVKDYVKAKTEGFDNNNDNFTRDAKGFGDGSFVKKEDGGDAEIPANPDGETKKPEDLGDDPQGERPATINDINAAITAHADIQDAHYVHSHGA